MVDSTSVHNLNADRRLGRVGQAAWMLLNFLNNHYRPRSRNLRVGSFCPTLDRDDWERIDHKSSPSRAISDLFWLKMDWNAIKSELGPIRIVDAGAGYGTYGPKINDFAQGIDSYLGTDLVPREEWKAIMREHDFITFSEQHSDDLLDVIPQETNFFMSQSSIEHFESDLLYFKQIRSFIAETNRNTVQVHLFPSAACLRLYRWHGIRQYTPRTVSKITRLFDSPTSYSMLLGLGGPRCNDLHHRFITSPLGLLGRGVDWRDTRPEEYRSLLKAAVEEDILRPSRAPAFYGLLIHSNFRNPIFKRMPSLNGRQFRQ